MKPAEPGAVGGSGETPAGETKVCPYCAETIRAAAIKCRYCQSDLTATSQEAPVAPSSAASLTEPSVADPSVADPSVAESPVEDSSSSPRPRRRWGSLSRRPGGASRSPGDRWSSRIPRLGRVPWVIGAVVLVTTLALLLLAVRDWREHEEISEAKKSGEVARAAVADKVESLLSYRYESFDDDVTAAQEMLTPSFRDEYAPTVAEIRKRALAQRRDQQAEVLAVGLVSSDEERVRTLVFVNTVSARQGSDRPATVMQNRVTVDLVRGEDGEGWLIDDLSFPST